MKVWARKVWEKTRRADLPHTTTAWVHDETVRDIPKEILRETQKIKSESFQETAELLYKGIPFSFESAMGRSWAAKSIESELLTLEED